MQLRVLTATAYGNSLLLMWMLVSQKLGNLRA